MEFAMMTQYIGIMNLLASGLIVGFFIKFGTHCELFHKDMKYTQTFLTKQNPFPISHLKCVKNTNKSSGSDEFSSHN